MFEVCCIEERTGFDGLRKAWNALLVATDPHSIFLSHEWTSCWYEAFGGSEAPHILLAVAGERVHGILPLLASDAPRIPMRPRLLRLMANGHSPCSDLVCLPHDRQRVVASLARALRARASDWDIAFLPEVSAGAAIAQLHTQYPDACRGQRASRRAPYIPLHGTWERYRDTLSKNFQKVLRHNANRVSKAGTVRVQRLDARADIERSLDDMFDIGERSWQGSARSAVGSTPENRRFYTAIARTFAARGAVRLWFLELDGRRVAFEFHLVHAGVEFGLKTGYDSGLDSLGLGTFLDQHIVRELFADDDLHEYNLLGDFDFYKQRWTQHAREYRHLTLYGGSWLARLRALWDVRLLPLLKDFEAVQTLHAAWTARRTEAGQATP